MKPVYRWPVLWSRSNFGRFRLSAPGEKNFFTNLNKINQCWARATFFSWVVTVGSTSVLLVLVLLVLVLLALVLLLLLFLVLVLCPRPPRPPLRPRHTTVTSRRRPLATIPCPSRPRRCPPATNHSRPPPPLHTATGRSRLRFTGSGSSNKVRFRPVPAGSGSTKLPMAKKKVGQLAKYGTGSFAVGFLGN